MTDFLSKLKNAIAGNPAGDWQSRLKGEIKFTSPGGDKHTAKWAGDNRTRTKKVAVFSAPYVNGSIVQDLGLEADRWPLTVYFDGASHDLDSEAFVQSFSQSGTWAVEHPVKGLLTLQPITIGDRIQPVTDGGYTRVDTDWIEPIKDGVAISAAQIADSVDAFTILANISSAVQFAANVVQDTVGQVRNLSIAVSSVVTSIRVTLRAIENFDIVPAEFEALIRNIEATAAETPIDTSRLSAQIQGVIQAFAPTSKSSTAGVEGYAAFAADMAKERPASATVEGKNQAAVQDLVLTAANASVAQTMLVGGDKTRSQSIGNAEATLDFFRAVTDTLDITQKLYRDKDIDFQYFSQSDSYTDNLAVATLGSNYKLISAFDLSVEKKIRLDVPRSPIWIVWNEYGDDLRLDEFIEANNIGGDSIYMLAAGDVVTVYL